MISNERIETFYVRRDQQLYIVGTDNYGGKLYFLNLSE